MRPSPDEEDHQDRHQDQIVDRPKRLAATEQFLKTTKE
jgi:hypothetical protein